jgi:hypothetical protein
VAQLTVEIAAAAAAGMLLLLTRSWWRWGLQLLLLLLLLKLAAGKGSSCKPHVATCSSHTTNIAWQQGTSISGPMTIAYVQGQHKQWR